MAKKEKPKKLWAFWANHFGPLYLKPQQVTLNNIGDSWWHKNGNSGIYKIGFTYRTGRFEFASEDKKDVQLFINGFMACRSLMSEFCLDGYKVEVE